MKKFVSGTLAAIFVSTAGVASAATIVDQSTFGAGFSPYSIGNGQRLASAFTLNSAFSVTGATWYGFNDASTGFGIQFFDNALNLPGSLLYTTTGTATKSASSTPDSVGNQIFRYDMTLAAAFASASGSYFFSVYDYASPSGNFRWKDGASPVTGGARGSGSTSGNSSGWVPTSSYAFTLQGSTVSSAGAVPEPTTWAMMTIGFGLAGALVRRRRRMTSVDVLIA